MVYIINYQDDVNEVFAKVGQGDRDYILNKLYEVARAEFREPWEWDYKKVATHPAGARLRVGDGLRVFVKLNRDQKIIEVHQVDHRENLY